MIGEFIVVGFSDLNRLLCEIFYMNSIAHDSYFYSQNRAYGLLLVSNVSLSLSTGFGKKS